MVVPARQNRDATQHLTNDDPDVLVVNLHALRAVDVLYLGDEVSCATRRPEMRSTFFRIHRALDQLLSDRDVRPLGTSNFARLPTR